MSDLELTERLDQAIAELLRNPHSPPVIEQTEIAELLAVAAELRELPRAEFKARLREELEGEGLRPAAKTPAQVAAAQAAQARRTVTPYLVVSDVHQEIDFVTRVFGAEGKLHGLGSQGGFHSEFKIGESSLMIGGGGEGSSWQGVPVPASLHAYVPDVDGVYKTALQAGATSLMPPTDMEYGERGAAIEDVGGNHWYLATAKGETYVPEGLPNLMPYFNPVGAPRMIAFLEQAFGAEQLAIHKSPSGTVLHAKVKIGDSIVEMGEAHGPWQPRPMHFLLCVENTDEWYERAMKAAGAISVGRPANQPYGRTGTVKDPFDNTWYVVSPVPKDESESESRSETMAAKLFRVALQVADLDQAAAFYARLLDDPGISIPRGSRHYFDCGGVILALVDVAKGGEKPQPTPDYIYFAVKNLEQVFERAKALNCLAQDRYHDQEAGQIVKRPWGELSFYVEDPWGNGLCFVDETTLFTGR